MKNYHSQLIIPFGLLLLFVVALVVAISLLGVWKILDGVTVGTLIGAIIGYALGRFRQD